VIPTIQTKAQDLLDKLSGLAGSRNQITELQIAALRREAKQSLQVDAFHGYMALGALASLVWDDEALHTNHQCAIKLSNSEIAHRNYAASLSAVLLYENAAKEMMLAVDKEPENLTSLRSAIDFSVFAGMIGTAMKLYQMLKIRSPESNEDDFNANRIAGIFAQTGIDESEFRKGQSIVLDILRRRRILPETISTHIDDDPADPSVWVKFEINESSQYAQEVHDEACARLCEELPDGGHPAVLMFSIAGTC
jgi:hypothetical protein